MLLKYRNQRVFTLMLLILALCGANPAAAWKYVPIVTETFKGHTYAVYDVSMTWHQAKAYCESLGGHLVTITSAEEQIFVQNLIRNCSKNQYWLGAAETTRTAGIQNHIWQWVTGEAWAYTNWSNGEPNNLNDVEHYLQMFRIPNPFNREPNALGKWNDITVDNLWGLDIDWSDRIGFICEWDYGYSRPFESWKKPWAQHVRLEVGMYNPADDAKRPNGHPTGTASWLPPTGPKYAVDLLPVSRGKPNPPIKIFAPIGGTIYCSDIYAIQGNSESCKKGHDGYGHHVIVSTDDGEKYMIAHLDGYNKDFKEKTGNLRVETGEYIGNMGNSKNLDGTTGNIVGTWNDVHLHFEVASRSFLDDDIYLWGIASTGFYYPNQLIYGDFSDLTMFSEEYTITASSSEGGTMSAGKTTALPVRQ